MSFQSDPMRRTINRLSIDAMTSVARVRTSPMGMFVSRTPATNRAGVTDVTIFLASNPDVAAVTLPAFFEYTPRDGGDLPMYDSNYTEDDDDA